MGKQKTCVKKSGKKGRLVFNPNCLTKIKVLREELKKLRKQKPKTKVVIFTQYIPVHEACVQGLSNDGFQVFQFTGSTPACKRDEVIRKFQEKSSMSAVFIITLRSGNIGITLTAASRVYLLEPSLNPTAETQAAGRIDRLGQNKSVEVIRYVFKDSYEANILDLHREILEGRITMSDSFVPSEAIAILSKGIL